MEYRALLNNLRDQIDGADWLARIGDYIEAQLDQDAELDKLMQAMYARELMVNEKVFRYIKQRFNIPMSSLREKYKLIKREEDASNSLQILGNEYSFFDDKGEFVKSITLNLIPTAKFFNFNSKRTFLLCKNVEDKPCIIPISTFTRVMREAGASAKEIEITLTYINSDENIPQITTIEKYEYDFAEKRFYLPPDHISTNLTGHGLEFFESYYAGEDGVEEGKDAYLKVLEACREGIGSAEALLISAFSIASPFAGVFKKMNRIVGQILCVGEPTSAKTTACEYLSNIAKFNNLHAQDELSQAVFSQMGSLGAIPIVLDDVDKLKAGLDNSLKVILTGISKRRRSTKDGDRRDAPEFLRTVLMTCNIMPEFMTEEPALLDRTIIIEFEGAPTNLTEWKRAQSRFDVCKSSVLNYLSKSDIDFNALKIEAGTENEVISIKNPRKRGIMEYIIFGLKILQKLGVNNITTGDVKKIKEMVLKTNEIALEEKIETIFQNLEEFSNNFEIWKKLTDASFFEEKSAREAPKCELKMDGDKEYYVLNNKTRVELNRKCSFNIKNLSELVMIMKTGGVNAFKRTSRLSFESNTFKCAWIERMEERIQLVRNIEHKNADSGKRVRVIRRTG